MPKAKKEFQESAPKVQKKPVQIKMGKNKFKIKDEDGNKIWYYPDVIEPLDIYQAKLESEGWEVIA